MAAANRSLRTTAAAAAATSPCCSKVQIDAQVVLKIIKHCQEGDDSTELLQGVLLGMLVADDRLEVTNCFPFPQHSEDDFDDVQYQMEMMRNLRQVNVDHLHVGWYQSTYHGAFLNKALIDSQFSYQNSIDESVVLIYDPHKTTQGFLSMKAFRLTPKAMELYAAQDFSPEAICESKLSHMDVFEEIPVVIKNSYLVNAMVLELQEQAGPGNVNKSTFLDLATSSPLEKHLTMLMECVDDLHQDSIKFAQFQRQVARHNANKQQFILRRQQENAARAQKGEPPLPEDDVNKLFKAPAVPSRIDSLLTSGQIQHYCQEVNKFASQSIGKMYMVEALHKDKTL